MAVSCTGLLCYHGLGSSGVGDVFRCCLTITAFFGKGRSLIAMSPLLWVLTLSCVIWQPCDIWYMCQGMVNVLRACMMQA